MAHQLQRGERAVAFVQVDDARRNTHRQQRADAADAEQQLLTDANAIVAAVQARGQLAVFRLVAVDVRVEQEQRVAADREGPDSRGDRSGARGDRHRDRLAVARGGLNGQQAAVHVEIVLVLAPVEIQPLLEVALVVVQAHAHERYPEVRRALDVIACEDAEAARVDRKRLVNTELGGEVGDGPRPQDARVARTPRMFRLEVLLQPAIGIVDPAMELELLCPFLQRLDGDLLQERNRIVIELAPPDRIELPKEGRRIVVPAPPEVARERVESLMRRCRRLAERPRFADDRRQLCACHDEHPDIVLAERPAFDGLDDEDSDEQAAIQNWDA